MKERNIREELELELKKSLKSKNAERAVYYRDLIQERVSACSSFERFKGTQAYQSWKTKNKNRVIDQNKEFVRFDWV